MARLQAITSEASPEKSGKFEKIEEPPRHTLEYLQILRRYMRDRKTEQAERLLDGLIYALENRR